MSFEGFVQVEHLNSQITLRSHQNNTLYIGESIRVLLINHSNKTVSLPQGFDTAVKILKYDEESDEWTEINNRANSIMDQERLFFPQPRDTKLYPEFFVLPDVIDNGFDIPIRVFIKGYEVVDNAISTEPIGAYLDIVLKTKKDIIEDA